MTIATGDGRAVEFGADAGNALRLAHRAWFRAGVRRGERRHLADEVHGELAAAPAAGLGVSAVLGTDPGDTTASTAGGSGHHGCACPSPARPPSACQAAEREVTS